MVNNPFITTTTSGTAYVPSGTTWVNVVGGGGAGGNIGPVGQPFTVYPNPYDSPKTLETVVDFIFAAVEAHLRRIIKEELEKAHASK